MAYRIKEIKKNLAKLKIYKILVYMYFFTKSFGIQRGNISLMLRLLNYKRNNGYSDEEHLTSTIRWLCNAQDENLNDNGVASVYSLRNGWECSYPETSGYIIATFLTYSELTGKEEYTERAKKIGDWEIDIQAKSGGVYSDMKFDNIAAFNTGQVMLGWLALYEKLGIEKYLNAAERAGNYLCEVQDVNGTWVKGSYSGARTYESRVDWALLKLSKITNNEKYKEYAIKNIDWIINQQNSNGWFENCGFHMNDPIMHTIDYTIRGLLECHIIEPIDLQKYKIMERIKLVIEKILNTLEKQKVQGRIGLIPSSYDPTWQGCVEDSCLTGNAQFCALLLRLSGIEGHNECYESWARVILNSLKDLQVIDSKNNVIDGGVAGSYPIYQGYMRNSFPNWAAKFFADALIMQNKIEDKVTVDA